MGLNTNLHILSGSLGRDPEVSYSASGTAICKVAVATSHWDSQKKENVTDWSTAKIIGKQAEYIGQYGKKGSEIELKGRVETRKYQDKNGQDRYITETICFEANLTRANKQEQPAQQARTQSNQTNEYAQQSGGTTRPGHTQVYGNSDPDEDVPL